VFQNSLRGLSIDFETGRLYAADRANGRVNVFTEDGKFVEAFGWGVKTGASALETCGPAVPEAEPNPALCKKGLATASPGGFGANSPTKLAVDNIVGSASRHDLYVVDEANRRLEKFHRGASNWELVWAKGGEGEAEGQFKSRISVGVGPAGAVYALDNLPGATPGLLKHRLQRLDPATGNPVPTQCILREDGEALDLAVAADGSSWVVNFADGKGLRKYDASCAPVILAGGAEAVETDFTNSGVSIALDQAGRVYLAAGEAGVATPGGRFQAITAHDATGASLSRFAYGRATPWNPEGLAVGAAGVFLAFGEIFAEAAGIRLLQEPTPPLPPPGPVVAPSLEVLAGSVGPTKAKVLSEVNPEGKQTAVHFEYLTREDYEAQGDSFTGPATESSPTQTIVPAAGKEFRLHAIEATIGCPDPANEAGLPGSPCLVPESEYLWRVVATNADGGGEGTLEGPAFETTGAPEILATFATEAGTDTARLGAEVDAHAIPTSGHFEYVTDAQFQASGFEDALEVPGVGEGDSPIDFGATEGPVIRSVAVHPLSPGTTYHYRLIATNTLIEPEEIEGEPEELRTFKAPALGPCANDADRIGPGALLPDCRAYELVSPLDKGGGDIRVFIDAFNQPAVLEQAADTGDRLAYGSLRSFGGALSAPLTSQYLADRIAGSEWQSHPINVARGRPLFDAGGQFDAEFKAFSPDLCRAWIQTFAEMPGAPAGFEPGFQNLVRRDDRLCGSEGLAALAPRGDPEGVPVGGDFGTSLQGVSADGSHAIFTANAKLAEGGKAATSQLYESVGSAPPRFVCLLPGETPFDGPCTAGTSAPNGQPRPRQGAISADGERIFFSVGGTGARPLYVRIGGTETRPVSGGVDATFWGAAGDGSVALFSTGDLGANAVTPAVLHTYDVDTEADEAIATGVRGVLGISEDASRIYFASEDVLPASGQNSEGEEALDGEPNLYLHEAGGGTSFIATLAEADVVATVSDDRYGKRNGQVAPDGEHAVFGSVAPLTDYDNVEGAIACGAIDAGGDPCPEVYRYAAGPDRLTCVSCNPSGARPAAPSTIPFLQSPMHATRIVSGNGARVYFQSSDRLVARDTNGKADVYQWEESGGGDCTPASYDYSPRTEGCVGLISSGQGLLDARLVESGPDGRDVFFVTVSSLLPQDYGLVDIYDARAGGGLPIPPPLPPTCEGDACHHPAAAPEPPAAASEGYEPPAEPKAKKKKAKACPKGKRRVSRGGKARCVAKRSRHANQRRAAR